MPALPRNPSSMTKERLAEELRKNNIPLPRGKAKKEVYVELYQRHLLDGSTSPQWTSYRNMSVNTSQKLGFSSDEEDDVAVKLGKMAVMNANNNRSQKKAIKHANKIGFEDRLAEVESLSDADLRRELQNRGDNPGPIVATTRAVYERKLADLLLQQEQEEVDAEEEEEEEEDSQENEDQYSDSDVDDKEDIGTQTSTGSLSSRTKSTYKSQVTTLIDQESTSKARQRIVTPKRKTETTTTEETVKTTSKQRSEDRGKPLIPVWLQILIFLIVAAFLVLIWYNMEMGQPESPLVT